MTSVQLIADSYTSYHRSVYLYICYRINSKEEAEDMKAKLAEVGAEVEVK